MAGSGKKKDFFSVHIIPILKTNTIKVENNLETR